MAEYIVVDHDRSRSRFLKNRAIGLAGLCMAWASGCATYHDPSVTISHARLIETSSEAVAVSFGLDLHNPNDEPLTLLEFTYDLSIDGRHVYDGTRAGESVLAIRGDKQVEIPGIIRFDRAGWTAETIPGHAAYALRGRLKYITPGKIVQILFDTGVRKPSASFSGNGDVELKPALSQ